MSQIRDYIKNLNDNKDKEIFIEGQRYTLGQFLNQTELKQVPNVTLDVYQDDIKETLINFFRCLELENSIMLYDTKGMESFPYVSLVDDKIFKGVVELPENCLVFRSSGSTGHGKFILHSKYKSIKKIIKNHESRTSFLPTLVMLHHGHIAWWEAVLTELLNDKPLYITNSFPLEGKSYPRPLNVRTTPSYLRLCFKKGFFLDGEGYSFFLGSEPITPQLKERIKKLGLSFYQVYGSTELWGLSSELNENSIGIDFINVNYLIKENILYVNDWDYIYDFIVDGDKVEKSQSQFCTQDVVEEIDKKIHILGRTQDYINVGGKKFHAAEIKEKINQLDFIDDTLVFSVENVLLGQVIGVEVIVNKKIKDLKDKIRDQFKLKEQRPVYIKVVDDFERTNSKKVARKI
jgi:acyl-coenzyme A synthetase/AMP-(fatty) acid ligase